MSAYGNVMGGKLNLKAKAIPTKKSKKKSKRSNDETIIKKSSKKSKSLLKQKEEEQLVPISGLTPAQKKHEKFKAKREEEVIKKQASKTYRERVEEFSNYLGNLTEHHDVPRVSAAGNG
ncbi:hypothetical protein THRCLA_20212 [Thraustotheca clavata]|uniref:DUF1754-domain-containing protein n=1 Tax=Thraustotheca clavata TaxID=74557 RepID=A0A1W0AA45_9STRA|nr:hypothetical protein THRCLA_20212 [Thraustotheca clavata]